TNSVPDPALASAALEAARRSIELGPENSLGHIALGTYYRLVDRDPTRALEEYRKGESLAPGNPEPQRAIGRSEQALGQWQEAIRHYKEAERLDPKNAINVGNASEPLLYLRRCGEARAEVDRNLAFDPANLSRIVLKMKADLCEGDVTAARTV